LVSAGWLVLWRDAAEVACTIKVRARCVVIRGWVRSVWQKYIFVIFFRREEPGAVRRQTEGQG